MKTISQRIFDNTLNGVPEDIIVSIGNRIDDNREVMELAAAIFVAVATSIKEHAGEPPSTNDKGKWFAACIGIGEQVYSMCCKRYPEEDASMMQKQAMAASYRGTVDLLIAKQASFKAKNYAIL